MRMPLPTQKVCEIQTYLVQHVTIRDARYSIERESPAPLPDRSIKPTVLNAGARFLQSFCYAGLIAVTIA